MKKYIYIHICCINNYVTVFKDLMNDIKRSGLYNVVTKIRCCILGNYKPNTFRDPKIAIRATNEDLNLYEAFTLNCLYDDAKNEDFMVLYLHTKGVTRYKTNHYENVKDWVDYMMHFNVHGFKKCIQLLSTKDAVGVNLTFNPQTHYSGNFWWSKSSHINKLAPCTLTTYNSPEFWLTEQNNGNFVSLWNSKIIHYYNPYKKYMYAAPAGRMMVFG